MAERAVFIGFGVPVRGREERAVAVFNDFVALFGRMAGDGRIESMDVTLLDPHGGDLGGFFVLHGTAEQCASLINDDVSAGRRSTPASSSRTSASRRGRGRGGRRHDGPVRGRGSEARHRRLIEPASRRARTGACSARQIPTAAARSAGAAATAEPVRQAPGAGGLAGGGRTTSGARRRGDGEREDAGVEHAGVSARRRSGRRHSSLAGRMSESSVERLAHQRAMSAPASARAAEISSKSDPGGA